MFESEQKGLVSYENWLAFRKDASYRGTLEYPLYTDAHMIGELRSGLEPYSIFNQCTIPHVDRNVAVPTLILRIDFHFVVEPTTADKMMSGTDVSRYHGGWIADEIAALLSLSLGVRLQAGKPSRRFELDGDPKGLPQASGFFTAPHLAPKRELNAVLPYTSGQRDLKNARIVQMLPKLGRSAAIALMKAARLYQDAIWMAESQPELAWLLLTSAIETAAVGRQSENPPIEKLKVGDPALYAFLEKYNDTKLVEGVADRISDHFKTTSKFVNFVIDLLPDPPKSRPKFDQFRWSKANFRKALSRIYDWRSQALHSGIPFPMPMCNPPIPNTEQYSETPPGLAAASSGAQWVADDIPMLLHLFEYIVRETLLKWWRLQIPEAEDG